MASGEKAGYPTEIYEENKKTRPTRATYSPICMDKSSAAGCFHATLPNRLSAEE